MSVRPGSSCTANQSAPRLTNRLAKVWRRSCQWTSARPARFAASRKAIPTSPYARPQLDRKTGASSAIISGRSAPSKLRRARSIGISRLQCAPHSGRLWSRGTVLPPACADPTAPRWRPAGRASWWRAPTPRPRACGARHRGADGPLRRPPAGAAQEATRSSPGSAGPAGAPPAVG